MYKVSFNGEHDSLRINFRGTRITLKEGDEYPSDSDIYRFFSKYFVPSVYYKEPEEEKQVPDTVVAEKISSIDEFSETINTSENDVIIEITNQEKDI